jgi:hypothetical protein
MDEQNGKGGGATIADAMGLATREEMDAAQAQIAVAQRDLIEARRVQDAQVAEIAELKVAIAERDKDLAAGREVVAEAQKTRAEAVAVACAAKGEVVRLGREIEALGAVLEGAKADREAERAKGADLWAKLRGREQRRVAWQDALVGVAAALNVGVREVAEPELARDRCLRAIEVLRTGQSVTEPVAAEQGR